MLVVDRITRAFGSVRAVNDISFSVARGHVFGLLGPNGAGKTTTMRMILNIYSPDSGSITWDGRKVGPATRRRFGYLPEERGLYGKMTVRDQIAFFGRLHGMTSRDAAVQTRKWMALLDIETYAKRPCGELSKGNQQKVQLAAAALHAPELLILDEPFSGLDPLNAEILRGCIRSLGEQGTTLVLSSHQMWQIENACNEFCIVAGGVVRASGTLAELRATYPTRRVRISPDLAAARAVFAAHDAPEPERENGHLVYRMPAALDLGALLREVVAAAPIDTFERDEPSLHEIYVHTIGGTPA